jgi:transcriptional regulator with XRE-family HTH domain
LEIEITPAQVRGARGLIGWSQDDLANAARVGVSTVRDFEAARRRPMRNNLEAIRNALEVVGIEFIPENGGGAGVRLKNAFPKLSYRTVSIYERLIKYAISYRSKEFLIRFSTDILNDLDRTNYETGKEFEAAFDMNINKILDCSAKAIDAGRASSAGELTLEQHDF